MIRIKLVCRNGKIQRIDNVREYVLGQENLVIHKSDSSLNFKASSIEDIYINGSKLDVN